MSITPYEDYRIAAGHNVIIGSLVNIETITPSGDEPFAAPKAFPLYDDGQVHMKLNRLVFTSGFPNIQWLWTRLTYKQYLYLRSTYCSGGLSGFVTIYTTLADGLTTYHRMNASIVLKKMVDIKSEYRFQECPVQFVGLEAAA